MPCKRGKSIGRKLCLRRIASGTQMKAPSERASRQVWQYSVRLFIGRYTSGEPEFLMLGISENAVLPIEVMNTISWLVLQFFSTFLHIELLFEIILCHFFEIVLLNPGAHCEDSYYLFAADH